MLGYLAVVTALPLTPCLSQANSVESHLEQLNIESFDESTLENYIIFLHGKLDEGIDLNSISIEELSQFIFLSDRQINSFLHYRSSYGPFVSPFELQAVPDFDPSTLELLRPFLRLGKNNTTYRLPWRQSLKKENQKSELLFSWQKDLQTLAGFKKNSRGVIPFEGDPHYLLVRGQHAYSNRLQFGFTLEKDAGEALFRASNSRTGFDHTSFYIEAQNVSNTLEQVNLGDFYLNMGQGLVHYGGFNNAKTSQVDRIVKRGRSFRSFRARSEDVYLRGVAAHIRLTPHVTIAPVVSVRNRDANIIAPVDSSEGKVFSSIKLGGLHRTSSEIEDEKRIRHDIYGGTVSFHIGRWQMDLNHLSHSFDGEFRPADRLDNKHDFRGNLLSNTSISYQHTGSKIYSFGEFAVRDYRSPAFIHGMLYSPTPRLDISFVCRYLDERYRSLGAATFSENSNPENEIGAYLGMKYHIGRGLSLSVFSDFFRHPGPRFRVSLPSQGSEHLLRLDAFKKRRYQAFLQLTYKSKETEFRGSENNSPIHLAPERRAAIRAQWNWHCSHAWELRTRFEFKKFDSPTNQSTGHLIFQDFLYRPLESRLSMNARLSYFNIDDFASRIYAYENNLIYQFQIPFYYGKGLRAYANLRYRWKNWTIESRYEHTSYLEDFEIGSGHTRITGRNRSRLKGQLIYRF